jgi:hypothetical protein
MNWMRVVALGAVILSASQHGGASAGTLVLSTFADKLLAEGNGNPIEDVPERVTMPPLAGTWTANIVDRLLTMETFSRDHASDELGQIAYKVRRALNIEPGSVNWFAYAPVMRLIGPADRLLDMQTRSAPDAKLHQRLSELCAPEANAEDEATCKSVVESRLPLAVIRWSLGDRVGPREILSEIESSPDIARLLDRSGGHFWFCVNEKSNHYECGLSIQSPWFFHKMQAGDINGAVAVLSDWYKRANAPGLTDYDDGNRDLIVTFAAEMLLLEGRLRDAARLHIALVANPNFQGEGNIKRMLEMVDQQISAAASDVVPIALLKIIAQTTSDFRNITPQSLDRLAMSIECRAAHIGVYARGDAASIAEFERLANKYLTLSKDDFQTGYCLARIAALLDRTELGASVRTKIDALRKVGMKEIRELMRNTAAASRRAGGDSWRRFEAMTPGVVAVRSSPQAPVLLDRAEFVRGVSIWLDGTKKIASPAERGEASVGVMRDLLWHFRLTSAQ